jgi:hypothetical protein
MAAGAAAGGDGTIPPLRNHRTFLTAAAAGAAALATVFCAARASTWWPLSAALGVAAMAWIVRCAQRRAPALLWLGVAALGLAYATALVSAIDPVDVWAAAYAALLLLVAELGHAAAGTPDMEVSDPATRGRYMRAVAAAVVGGFGVAELLLAAAGAGGSGGAEVTALGVACAAAALALLAATARRTAAT